MTLAIISNSEANYIIDLTIIYAHHTRPVRDEIWSTQSTLTMACTKPRTVSKLKTVIVIISSRNVEIIKLYE